MAETNLLDWNGKLSVANGSPLSSPYPRDRIFWIVTEEGDAREVAYSDDHKLYTGRETYCLVDGESGSWEPDEIAGWTDSRADAEEAAELLCQFMGWAAPDGLRSPDADADAVSQMAETPWTQADAIALAVRIEAVCPAHGCHVALTGGLLYKPGPRKDADFLFYRIREVDEIDVSGLFEALSSLGIVQGRDHGWCKKATYDGKPIDFFFPDDDGAYPEADLTGLEWADFDAVEVFKDQKAEARKDRADLAALNAKA